ncbi:transposase [Streptomyces avidinii]|uniref:transposase n=1 Tax=Streptomyces avidinii TaxID=1895 RepID=UPI0037B73F76
MQTKARSEQTTAEWRRRCAIRAGCEATVSETVHAHGLRNCRYRGMARTHVQHVLTAAGTNIIRLSGRNSPSITPPRGPRPRSRSNNSAAACLLKITNSIRKLNQNRVDVNEATRRSAGARLLA